MMRMMLCNTKQYYRSISQLFYQSRRSYTQTRQLKDLQQIYELLKEESLCKSQFFPPIDFINSSFSFHIVFLRKDGSKWNIC